MKDNEKIALGVGGLVIFGGLFYAFTRSRGKALQQEPAPQQMPPPPSAPPPPPPSPPKPSGWYASAADRDKRIAAATEAVLSGDVAKIAAAIARLSPEDRAKLEQMAKPKAIPFYGTTAERDKRIAAATAAVQSGDPAKIAAALAKLSPEDRANLEKMVPHL